MERILIHNRRLVNPIPCLPSPTMDNVALLQFVFTPLLSFTETQTQGSLCHLDREGNLRNARTTLCPFRGPRICYRNLARNQEKLIFSTGIESASSILLKCECLEAVKSYPQYPEHCVLPGCVCPSTHIPLVLFPSSIFLLST